MARIAHDSAILFVVSTTSVNPDAVLAAAASAADCGTVPSSRVNAILTEPSADDEALQREAPSHGERALFPRDLLVSAPAHAALRLRSAHPGVVAVALVNSHSLFAASRDPHHSRHTGHLNGIREHLHEFDYVVPIALRPPPYLNDGLEDTDPSVVDALAAIIVAERYRASRQMRLIEGIRSAALR